MVLKDNKPDISLEAVSAWLESHFGSAMDYSAMDYVEPLSGGFWSKAFAFSHDGHDRVVRFNADPEGFAIDRAAFEFSNAGIPVPEVTETGQALGLHFAISKRHYGMFLEDIPAERAAGLEASVTGLLTDFRKVASNDRVMWYDPTSDVGWRDYLLAGLGEPQFHKEFDSNHGKAEQLFVETKKRIRELLPLCPERRDLVHGDLLHQNVLVSSDFDEITAVFSWKCSAFGDFLYDVAWLTHWSPWHPGIAQMDVFGRTVNADDLGKDARANMTERHHCYELQIAASHIGWYLSTNDDENLGKLAANLTTILDRGPLAIN